MRNLLLGGAALLLLAPIPALAQSSPFDGTWKADVASAHFPKKPDVYVLAGGVYSCKTCTPPYSVKADGADHPVKGNPYSDTAAVTITGNTLKEVDKKADKVVGSSTTTLLADGKTTENEFTNNSGSTPVTGKFVQTKVAAGPKGSSPFSGSWHTTKFENLSDNGLTVTYKVDGDTLSRTSPTGMSFDAKMDGTDSPVTGDPGVTSVSVRKVSANEIQITEKRHGKTVSVNTVTVEPGGKTSKVAVNDKLAGTHMSFTTEKQ